jgi:hypothetical protein
MDGELTGVDHVAIHHHLGQCPSCRNEYEGLLKLKRLLGRMRLQEPRPELQQEILHYVGQAHAAREADPLARIRDLHERLHNAIPTAPIVALGAGLAVLGMFLTLRATDDGMKFTPAPPAPGMSSVALLPNEKTPEVGFPIHMSRGEPRPASADVSYQITMPSPFRAEGLPMPVPDLRFQMPSRYP